MNKFTSLFVILLLALPTVTPAHDDDVLFDVIKLQVQVEAQVPNDRMQVILAAEKEGTDPQAISLTINQTMRWALDIIKQYPDIDSNSGNYRTTPIYNKQTISAWRSVQEIVLESESISKLSELTGTLQQRLQVRNMSFSPSKGQADQFEARLVDEGMLAFRARAEQLRKHMNGRQYRIIEIDVNTGRQHPPVRYETSAVRSLSMDAAPPAVEAGTSELTVTVSGSVQYF